MNAKEPESADTSPTENGQDQPSLRAWVRPELSRLRAGAAEQTPGASIFDGTLETIGS